MLYQITAMIVALTIAAGLFAFFVINSSYNRLVEKSTDKLVEEEAKTINNALDFINNQMVEELAAGLEGLDFAELKEIFLEAFQGGEMSEAFQAGNELLKELVESGTLGLTLAFEVVLPMPPILEQTTIVVSSDESLVFEPLPDYLETAIEDGEDYLFLEDGVPEFGLEGEYLVYFFNNSRISPLLTGFWSLNFVPMGDAIADIQEFYRSEKNRATWILAIILGGTILMAFLIIFFLLSFLIRKRITQPIDELSAVAEEVMQGNLDVDIEVKEGEEFEGLKRAFKEMIEGIKKVISRSTLDE